MGQDCTQMLKNDVVVKMEDNPLSLIEGLSGGSPLPLSLSHLELASDLFPTTS